MSTKESVDVHREPLSVLDVTVDNVVQLLKTQDEEVLKLDQKKTGLETEIENQKVKLRQLELEKTELDGEVTILKLRNATYQKEHTNLRNAITVIKFQIEKIKESITKAKMNDLKDLEEFEKAVDEITEKFRCGPDLYDRKILCEKIAKEQEKKAQLIQRLEEMKNSYETFNSKNGLRARTNENEELLACVLPGSASFDLIETTKTLNEVICQIKKVSSIVKQSEYFQEDQDSV